MSPVVSYSQISPDQVEQGKELLEEKDISQDEVRAKLLERGIDPDNIPPEKLPEMESILQEIIAEIQAEKGLETEEISDLGFTESTVQEQEISSDTAVVDDDTSVLEDVQEGASLKEAISENLSEEQPVRRGGPAVFGQHIFWNNSVSVYRTTESPYVPNNYVLDVGDQIAVTIFGASQADVSYEIEKDGFIRPSNMPKIYLKGLSYARAKRLITNRFRQSYSFNPGEINITLQTARTITVNIYGEIATPGTYTISALNNAINAIMAAGGVNSTGSVRNIQIVRNGRTRTLDLYDFINSPGKNADYHLENNDVIFIPIVEKVVSIGGAVKRPARYEMLDNEDFRDLLSMANGFTPNADQTLMNVTTFDGNKPVHMDLGLADILDGKQKVSLKHGESYFIRTYSREAEDYVMISGPVDFQGKYALQPDMKVSDLITLAQLNPYAREDLAFIFRRNRDGGRTLLRVDLKAALENSGSPADLLLSGSDQLVVYKKSTYKDFYSVSITGAVRNEYTGFFSAQKNMTVVDLIDLAGGLQDQAADFGYIISTSAKNSKKNSYSFIDVKTIVANPSSSANQLLKPNDKVFIFSAPSFTDAYTIEISGAVRKEVTVPYSKNLTLKYLITMAEGLKPEAASNKIDIYRLKMSNNEATRTIAQTIEIDANFNPLDGQTVLDLRPNDRIVVRYTPEYEPMKFVELKGEVKYPGTYALLHDNETMAELIDRAGGLTQEAYAAGANMIRVEDIQGPFVVDLEKALKSNGSSSNLAMKNGDVLIIPKTMDHVSIGLEGTNATMTYTEDAMTDDMIHLGYHGNKSARWYINNYSGGFSDRAIRRSTQVIKANGQIRKTHSILGIKFYPRVKKGSTIVVKEKPPKEKKDNEGSKFSGDDFLQSMTNILTLTTTALTTAILAKTL